MKRFWQVDSEIKVTYWSSEPHYQDGYELLQELTDDPRVSWYARSGNFKFDLLKLINPADPTTVMFTDDSVLIRPFSMDTDEFRWFLFDSNAACFSMRLSPSVTHCFATDEPSPPPEISLGSFDWTGRTGDWGYPMSVEGHIFRTNDLLPLIMSKNFTNPCILEAVLAADPIRKPLMYCCEQSSMINIPLNKVAWGWNNPHGDVSAEWLNNEFLSGKRIDMEPYVGYKNTACHVVLPVVLISPRPEPPRNDLS
jgi:hypothetical protein